MADISFPFFGDGITGESEVTALPLYKEIAWDFQRNIPIMTNGNFKIVTGNEAIKTWCYKALVTKRFREQIYSWNYGSEFEKLIGSQYTPSLAKAECVRYVEECLLINPYIKGISEIEVSFYEGKLDIYCKIETVYGNSEVEVSL